MTDILARENKRVLARYAVSKLLVAFDFDGTLAPIVALPHRARMRPTTRRLLRRVAERYPCVVISGRARADLVRRLRNIPILHVSGNHGIEPWAEKRQFARLVDRWVQQLTPRLAGVRGVHVEDKVYSLSIHYRAARNTKRALRAIDLAVTGISGARRIPGKQVLNLVPRGAPSKGAALERARRMLVCDHALYVGDDETDEDAFGRRGRLLSVRVGPAERTRAAYILKHQRNIDALLRELVALRPDGRLESR